MEAPWIAVTLGDPAGIGPEIVAKAVTRPDVLAKARPLVVGSAALLGRVTARLCRDVRVAADGLPSPHRMVVHDVPLPDLVSLRIGEVQLSAGHAAAVYVETAVRLARSARVAAIATAPISKQALWAAGYRYAGHTEMLQALTGSPYGLTMFQVRNMRIFFLTRHLALRDALAHVTAENVLPMLVRIKQELEGIGLPAPRIALAALNPHAGEGGALGTEEQEQLQPAVVEARCRGIDVSGPVPADAVFARALEGHYDAVLALYHDQGHIAAKTVAFHETVSVTLGLPFIRTSVDHGTAFDIAGKGLAREDSMAAAIVAAADLAVRRAASSTTDRER